MKILPSLDMLLHSSFVLSLSLSLSQITMSDTANPNELVCWSLAHFEMLRTMTMQIVRIILKFYKFFTIQ